MSTEPTKSEATKPQRISKRWFAFAFIAGAVVTFLVAALLMNIFTRKMEAKNPYVRVVDVDAVTTDPAEWGKNWSRQYDGYTRTVDRTFTKYGGSEGTPPDDRLKQDPWLVRMFAGYAFSIDFRERRGHAYMLS